MCVPLKSPSNNVWMVPLNLPLYVVYPFRHSAIIVCSWLLKAVDTLVKKCYNWHQNHMFLLVNFLNVNVKHTINRTPCENSYCTAVLILLHSDFRLSLCVMRSTRWNICCIFGIPHVEIRIALWPSLVCLSIRNMTNSYDHVTGYWSIEVANA